MLSFTSLFKKVSGQNAIPIDNQSLDGAVQAQSYARISEMMREKTITVHIISFLQLPRIEELYSLTNPNDYTLGDVQKLRLYVGGGGFLRCKLVQTRGGGR